MRTTQDEGEIKRYQSIEKRRQRLFVVLCFRCVAIIEEDVCVCVRARACACDGTPQSERQTQTKEGSGRYKKSLTSNGVCSHPVFSSDSRKKKKCYAKHYAHPSTHTQRPARQHSSREGENKQASARETRCNTCNEDRDGKRDTRQMDLREPSRKQKWRTEEE